MAQRYIQIAKTYYRLDHMKLISAARTFLIVAILMLQACTTTQNRDESVVIDDQGIGDAKQSVTTQTAPAISSLLDQSKREVDAGNLDEGARVLERALRIEPANPEIWYKMAQIKFLQTDYAQAAVTASRSNTFVGKNVLLRTQNLTLMLESYKALGDSEQVDRIQAQINNIQHP